MFKLNKKIAGSIGRAGVIETPHGEIRTPAFVAVGTKATVKSVTPEMVREAGSQVVLANTYHLYLEPGEEVVRAHGGLHDFMNWQGPIMTDSGGFQAFSLGVAYGQGINKFIASDAPDEEVLERGYSETTPKKAKITEDGVEFKSILDGSTHFFSPEKSMQIQQDLGADIIFAFDECTSPHASKEYLREAMERTHRWGERSLREHKRLGPTPNPYPKERGKGGVSLFGIVQGGRHEDLRKASAQFIGKMDFDGFGIGGSFVKEDMATAVRWVNEILPEEKPRHLLGVGEPLDLFLAVENGCDTFDCVAPTRMARNGGLYTRNGKINILNAKFKNQIGKFDPDCECYTCQNYTASYLAHLFRAKEMFGATLATIHNIHFLNSLVDEMRESILADKFFDLKQSFFSCYK